MPTHDTSYSPVESALLPTMPPFPFIFLLLLVLFALLLPWCTIDSAETGDSVDALLGSFGVLVRVPGVVDQDLERVDFESREVVYRQHSAALVAVAGKAKAPALSFGVAHQLEVDDGAVLLEQTQQVAFSEHQRDSKVDPCRITVVAVPARADQVPAQLQAVQTVYLLDPVHLWDRKWDE